jgi:branched-chain amino acid aminotransferase
MPLRPGCRQWIRLSRLMVDCRGRLAEHTGAIFSLSTVSCTLPDPTARSVGVVEQAIMPDEIARADQAFLTGSAAEVTPVGEIVGVRGN